MVPDLSGTMPGRSLPFRNHGTIRTQRPDRGPRTGPVIVLTARFDDWRIFANISPPGAWPFICGSKKSGIRTIAKENEKNGGCLLEQHTMISLKKIGLVAAVLLFAALVCVPGVSAAGPGQGSQDTSHQGNDQGHQGNFAQGFAPGGSQGSQNGQNGGQGSNGMGQGSSGSDNGNNANRGTGQMAGNMTQRQGQPPGDFGNMTGNATAPGPMVLGNMTSFGPGERFGPENMTFCNATDSNGTPCQPFDGNATQAWGNETRQHQYGDNSTWQFQHQVRAENGNTTANAPAMNGNGPDNGGGQGISQGQGQQAQGSGASTSQSQDQKDADLISAFLKWLKGQ